jgi:hypothetical protein
MATRPALLGDNPQDPGNIEVAKVVENDLIREGDSWYWYRLSAEKDSPDSRFLVLRDAQSLVPGTTAEIQLKLLGLTDDPESRIDHHVRVVVNNRWVRDLRWKGAIPYLLIEKLPPDLLYPGDNVVEIHLPGELDVFADQVLVDWLEIRYATWGETRQVFEFTARPPREPGLYEYEIYNQRGRRIVVFDLTDPMQPVEIIGPVVRREELDSVVFHQQWEDREPRTFAIAAEDRIAAPERLVFHTGSTDLLAPPRGADLIVISHPDLVAALGDLVEHRKAQGLRTTVATTDEVYAHFSHGFVSPTAIRNYAKHGFVNWPAPAPSFLLLVGDASSDPLDRLGHGSKNLLPAYVSPRGGYAADRWFALLTEGDRLPDISVGRLAVNTAGEAKTVVRKILEYERDERTEPWRNRVLLIADDDPVGRFFVKGEKTTEILTPLGYRTQELSIRSLGLAPELSLPDRIAAIGSRLFPQVRDAVNRGVGIMQFFGHGGPRIWSHEHVLDARESTRQVEQLTNRERLPLVLSYSCLTASFDNPRFDTIAERLVASPAGGAVAYYGSSGNTRTLRGWSFAVAAAGISSEGASGRLGAALAVAQLEKSRVAGARRNAPVDSGLLIGDPALVLDLDLP